MTALGEDAAENPRVLREAVLAYAYRITGSKPRAEELTQEAFLRLMTTRAWNRETQPSLLCHLFGIVKSLRSAELISARRRYEQEAGREQARLAGGAFASPEASALERARRDDEEEHAARRIEALRAKLDPPGHVVERAIWTLMADEGITKPAELARATRRSYEKVVAALRRIREYAKSIEAAERGKDEKVA